MNEKKSDFNFFDYEIIIKKNNDVIFGYIADLSLYSSAKSAELVLLNLEKKFNDTIKHYEETQSLHLIKNRKKQKKNILFKYELLLFLSKFFIVGFLGFVFLILAGTFLANKFQQISIIDIMSSETKKISRLIDNQMDKKLNNEENIEKFKNILLQIRPYIDAYDEISKK